MPNSKLMTADEIFKIAKTFVGFGITKIRLTGGEPLIRSDFHTVITQLATLPVSLHITTNGYFLHEHIDTLVTAGIKEINVSVDSLNEQHFNTITQTEAANKVFQNIQLAANAGLKIKINNVLIKDLNDNEIIDFINLTKNQNISVRFIEFMPFTNNKWHSDKTVSLNDILEKVQTTFSEPLIALKTDKNSTTKNYQLQGYRGDFGVISTVTAPFCSTCNRIRLTADGKLKNCLFATEETDLLTPLRANEAIETHILANVNAKKESRGGMTTNEDFKTNGANHKNRSMIAIGG